MGEVNDRQLHSLLVSSMAFKADQLNLGALAEVLVELLKNPDLDLEAELESQGVDTGAWQTEAEHSLKTVLDTAQTHAHGAIPPPEPETDAWRDLPTAGPRVADIAPQVGAARAAKEREKPPNKDFNDRFQDAEYVAEGGMGVVWKCADPVLRRTVAIKELHPAHAKSTSHRSVLQREAQVTSQLVHPAVVPIYELSEAKDGSPFYTMRLVEGKTLGTTIAAYYNKPGAEPKATLFRLVESLVSVCNAVAFAHKHKILHRDLKPGNIIIGEFGETLVLDWGLARSGGRHEAKEPTSGSSETFEHDERHPYTLDGSVKGTAQYMPLEQARGEQDKVHEAADIYALGAVLYATITGYAPYHGRDNAEVLQKVIAGPPKRPRARNPNAPPALEAICLKAMSRNIDDRYKTVLAMAEDLNNWLADVPVSVYPEPVLVRAGRWARRHQTKAAALAALLATSVAALSISSILLADQSSKTERARLEAVTKSQQALAALDESFVNYSISSNIINSYLVNVAEELLIRMPQKEVMRRDLLDQAVRPYDNFLQQRPGNPMIRRDAAQVLRRAANLHRLTGQYDKASSLYHKAITLLQSLLDDYPQSPLFQDRMAETCNDYGEFNLMISEPLKARLSFERALEIARSLRMSRPDSFNYRRTTAISLRGLALTLKRLGEPAKAHELLNEASQLFAELVESDHALATDHILEGNSNLDLAILLRERREFRAIEPYGTRALAIARRLLLSAPDDPDIRCLLGQALAEQGRMKNEVGAGAESLAEARECFTEAHQVLELLVDQFPSVIAFRSALADVLDELATSQEGSEQFGAARESLQQAAWALEGVNTIVTGSPHLKQQLVTIYEHHARIANADADLALERACLEKARRVREKMLTSVPADGPAHNERTLIRDVSK